MKKTKIIASLLSLSLLSSVSGCSLMDGDNKNVLKAAEEYAEAVISGDAGDIASLSVDDDDFEEEVGAFMESCTSNDNKKDAINAVLDTMSYEIDKKSAESSKKSGGASVDITFTMIDYMSVYDDLGDGAGFDDYIDALEDGTEDACEVTVTVEFELDDDEWLVNDDDFENIYEVYEFYGDIAGMVLGNVHSITADQFQNALEGSLGLSSNDYYVHENDYYQDIYYYGDGFMVETYIYVESEADSAGDYFEDAFEDYEDMVENGDFEGTTSCYNDADSGYIVFDGESFDYDFFDDDIYGGIYYYDNIFVIIVVTSDDPEDHAVIDSMISALGYPAP